MNKKTLINSGFVAALAAALPATIAAAGTTIQADEASFVAAAGGAGMSFAYGEDFSSYTITGGFNSYPSPWASTVSPNIGVEDTNGSSLQLVKGSHYYGSVPDNAMGAGGSAYANTIVTIAGGASAVGFDVWSYGTFIANAFDAFDYTVKDTGGNVLASGTIANDGNIADGYLGVVSDTDLIGSVELVGTVFGVLATNELAANIQVWNVPAPGALAVFGLGGAFAARRRR